MKDNTKQKKNENYYYNSSYIVNGIDAFFTLRSEGKSLLDNFICRLTNYSRANQEILSNKKHSFIGAIYKILGIKIKVLYEIFNFLRSIPEYHSNKNKILKWSKENNSYALTATVSFSRIKPAKNKDIRDLLFQISKTIPNKHKISDLQELINNSKNLILCEPVFKSILKENYKKLPEDIAVIDGNLLMFTSLIELIKFNFNSISIFIDIYKNLKSANSKLENIKIAMISSLLLEGYNKLLGKFNKINSIYYTSNSFIIEILRLYLLQNDSCSNIYEVLHGIPTNDVKNYFNKIVNSDKHKFYSQIPLELKSGVLKNNLINKGEIGINSYLNLYLDKINQSYNNLTDFIKSTYKDIFSYDIDTSKDLIINFLGNNSHDKNYFISQTFDLEKLLLTNLIEYLSNKNISYKILYSPHPKHDIESFYKDSFFAKHKIYLHQDTIYAWFISNASISLFSSAIFEASYLGSQSFSPMIEQDGIYTKNLLNNLFQHDAKNVDELKTNLNIFLDFVLDYNFTNRQKLNNLDLALKRIDLLQGKTKN